LKANLDLYAALPVANCVSDALINGAPVLDRLREDYFRRLTDVIEQITGIKLVASKQAMLEGRLRKRVRALGLATLDDYAEFIFEQGGFRHESAHIVNCATTNKTDFFREPEHFTFLANQLIPQILSGKPRGARHLKFWSAAASIGAEAFTLAMLLADMACKLEFEFSILGTDICSTVLEQARRAIYSIEMLNSVPDHMLEKFVMPAKDPARQEMRIVPELRRRVQFKQLNLMDEDYALDTLFDVIFCRNILIYFAKEKQERVVKKLARYLAPDGFLILGHSESMAGSQEILLEQVAPTIFQRK
jgi:chemotaxis protein methyltransferase CheR